MYIVLNLQRYIFRWNSKKWDCWLKGKCYVVFCLLFPNSPDTGNIPFCTLPSTLGKHPFPHSLANGVLSSLWIVAKLIGQAWHSNVVLIYILPFTMKLNIYKIKSHLYMFFLWIIFSLFAHFSIRFLIFYPSQFLRVHRKFSPVSVKHTVNTFSQFVMAFFWHSKAFFW